MRTLTVLKGVWRDLGGGRVMLVWLWWWWVMERI
jgi:hypothetical protein